MKKLGVAVVGCGRIANSAHLPAIKALSDEVELVAVVDTIEERAKKSFERFGAGKMYLSTEEAFKDPEIDAVVLCLAHHLHAPVTVEACGAGLHVLVEKPMANTVEEADRMIEAAERAGVTLMVGQSRRFHLAAMESKRRFGEIGKPLQMITNWMGYIERPATDWWRSAEKAGGLLIALQGSHAVDYILWMAGKLPIRVYAESNHNNPEWEGEDDAVIQMRFDDGMIATILLSFNAKGLPYERFIVGSRGTMYLRGETLLRVNDKEIVNGEEEGSNFRRQLKEFASAIREGREPIASGRDVRKVIQVLEAARESIREHRVVEL
ncbi:MAG: Gfo/Idh/MocA family protein [bacterium]